MGYAWLLRERDGADTARRARRARSTRRPPGCSNVWNSKPPMLLTDASPRFESVMRRLDTIRPQEQLGAAWTLASRTGGHRPRGRTRTASRTGSSTA
ncbi:MAG: hypothetical protein M0C28_28840 [Candidatus Moduliflexus flocculans]|nr:hypothetical protein [Candidatus Moduliflexus flocculans]